MYDLFTMPNTPKRATLNKNAAETTGEPIDERASLMLCVGKDCAGKHPTAFDDLTTRARAGGCDVDFVKCQGSCTGPTAVLHDGVQFRWFEDLKKAKARRDLVAFASGDAAIVPDRLKKRELRGRDRDKAQRKLSAQLRRR